jgi:hypothetical protein
MKKRVVIVFIASLLLLLMASCSGLKPTPMPTETPQVLPDTGEEYLFVTNRLLLPTTNEQVEAFALNVDGDSKGRLDNRFGELLNFLNAVGPGLDLQSTLDQAILTGQMVSLHLVKANDILNDQSVSWTLFQGQKTQSPPNFDGFDTFTIDSSAPFNALVLGSLTDGHFTGGPGTALVELFFMNLPIDVNLIAVHLEADLSAQGCTNGKLGGGLTVDEFRSKLLPIIAVGINEMIQIDNSAANSLLQSLDSDRNGTITVQEIENNPLFKIAISPDLDLLDASGVFNPGQDGVKDSYSIGLGFNCVPAIFTLPGEE